MTLTLEIEPEIESLLEKRARADGCDVRAFEIRLELVD